MIAPLVDKSDHRKSSRQKAFANPRGWQSPQPVGASISPKQSP
jgi:hypothetical protein